MDSDVDALERNGTESNRRPVSVIPDQRFEARLFEMAIDRKSSNENPLSHNEKTCAVSDSPFFILPRSKEFPCTGLNRRRDGNDFNVLR
jgi:hypothetical protein